LEERVTDSLRIRGGTVLTADGDLVEAALQVEGGRIRGIGAGPGAAETIDADGCFVLPGLVDLHTHGIRRLAVSEGSLAEYAGIEAEYGATSFCPTLFGPPAALAEQMARHRRETDELASVPSIAGFRLESPYLAKTGAGLAGDLARIRPEVTGALLEAGGGRIRIWDVSPELPGAAGLIASLSTRGVVCSIAHTSATIEQARQAVDAGCRLVTHLYDVFDLPTVSEPGAYPASLVDYLVMEDRLVCELIVDGTHVHPLLVRKALRCAGPARIALVTDSNVGAGLPPGRHVLPGGWGPVEIRGPNDGVRLVERGMCLAGSALTPIDGLRNVVRLTGCDLATASRMASLTPARLLGLDAGEIAVGRLADLIILDRDLALQATIVRGRVAWRRT
jgi:N-acetylglucosamine-6-phosphate deacetylase